jgi:opacity protein-like surface antigen
LPTRALAALAVALAVTAALAATPAHAKKPAYAHGYYAEAAGGATVFLVGGEYIAPGPALQLRTGYEPMRWLGLGVRLGLSTHEAQVPPPPEQEYFQFWDGAATARLQVRFWSVGLFAEGGLGVSYVNTNVLDKVGLTEPDGHASFLVTAGGGLDYHTQNRHFSVGLGADWTSYASFDAASAVTMRVYLRYTK